MQSKVTIKAKGEGSNKEVGSGCGALLTMPLNSTGNMFSEGVER